MARLCQPIAEKDEFCPEHDIFPWRGGCGRHILIVMSLGSDMPMTQNGRQGSAAFRIYAQEMARVRFVSREEEARLSAALCKSREAALRLDSGEDSEPLRSLVNEGRKAEHRLAEAHLPLVVSMAQCMLERNRNVGVSLEDLVSAGNEGLLEGLRRYDPSRGYRVNTYVRWWIRNKMSEEVRLYRWKIRIPDHVYRQLLRIMRAYRWLFQESGRDPTEEQVAGELAISAETLRSFVACWGAQDMLSLDRRVGEDGRTTFGDLVKDPRDAFAAAGDGDQVVQEAESDLLREAVAHALGQLPQREASVIIMRYGLEDDEPRTFKEVGRKLGLSGERARQIAAKAIRKLRHPSRSKKLKEFLG